MKHNNDKTMVRRVRLVGAWAWHKEEEWLNRMAKKGWLLTNITFLVYHFRKAEPGNWAYQLDYDEVRSEGLDEYKQIFRDAGWKYVANLASWHYFRANVDDGAIQPIHTNNESRIKMLWKVMRLLLIAAVPSYIWMMTTGQFLQQYIESGTFTFVDGVMIFVMLMMVIIAYAVLRLFLKIVQLKREGKE